MTVKKHHVVKYPHMRQLRLAPQHALHVTSYNIMHMYRYTGPYKQVKGRQIAVAHFTYLHLLLHSIFFVQSATDQRYPTYMHAYIKIQRKLTYEE